MEGFRHHDFEDNYVGEGRSFDGRPEWSQFSDSTGRPAWPLGPRSVTWIDVYDVGSGTFAVPVAARTLRIEWVTGVGNWDQGVFVSSNCTAIELHSTIFPVISGSWAAVGPMG